MRVDAVPFWLLAVLPLLLLLGGCQSRSGSGTAPKGTEEDQHRLDGDEHGAAEVIELPLKAIKLAAIKTTPVSYEPLSQEIEATAIISPNEYRMAHVNPRISGRAISVKADLGDVVEAGSVLAELDSIQLGEKKAAFLQARASLDVARRNYRREQRLFKEQISSEREYLEAEGEFKRSLAAFRAAREALRLVGLSNAEIDEVTWGGTSHPLSHFPLLAPLGGTVIERHLTVGELIEPGDNPFTIADLSTVWIVVDVYEKDLARVAVGTATVVTVDAYPGETFRGTITYIGHVLDPNTRTARARVVIDNRDGRLRPGMFARATITASRTSSQRVLVLPREAIQRVRGQSVAFVEKRAGAYEMREVDLGREAGNLVEIRSGLAEGERVVTAGAFYVKSTLLKKEMAGHGH